MYCLVGPSRYALCSAKGGRVLPQSHNGSENLVSTFQYVLESLTQMSLDGGYCCSVATLVVEMQGPEWYPTLYVAPTKLCLDIPHRLLRLRVHATKLFLNSQSPLRILLNDQYPDETRCAAFWYTLTPSLPSLSMTSTTASSWHHEGVQSQVRT